MPRIRSGERADPRIVIDELPRRRLLRLAKVAIELQDIGDVVGNLVSGAVAADDDVSHVGLAGEAMLPWRAYREKERRLVSDGKCELTVCWVEPGVFRTRRTLIKVRYYATF